MQTLGSFGSPGSFPAWRGWALLSEGLLSLVGAGFFPARLIPLPTLLQEAYNAVVRYFGESPKTTPPSVFFPVFVRFIRSYKVSREVSEEKRL